MVVNWLFYVSASFIWWYEMVKAMVGGCCVCSDERGWDENPLVYCDGHGCSVAVHQGICSISVLSRCFFYIYVNTLFCFSLLWNCPGSQRSLVLSKVRISRTNCESGRNHCVIFKLIKIIVYTSLNNSKLY